MEERVTPGAFYGSAIAALIGLLSGLMLHGAWQDRPGGPRLQLSSAQAAELPASSDQTTTTDSQDAWTGGAQLAALDTAYYASADPGYITPDPLPVTRLAPGRFGPVETNANADDDVEVTEASAEPATFDGGGEDQTADTARAPAVSDFN
jgi:hypothetical protein